MDVKKLKLFEMEVDEWAYFTMDERRLFKTIWVSVSFTSLNKDLGASPYGKKYVMKDLRK